MLRVVLLGTSLVGGFFAARQSRALRHRARDQQQQSDLGPFPSTPTNQLAPSPSGRLLRPLSSSHPLTQQAAQSTQPSTTAKALGRFSKLQACLVLLVLQALLSMALIARGDVLRPVSLPLEPLEWIQILSILSLGALTVHALAIAMLSSRIESLESSPVSSQHVMGSQVGTSPWQQQPHHPLAPLDHSKLHSLSGVWIKDKQLSDSMDAACDLIELHGIVRAAINLIKGVEIHVTQEEFRFSVLSGFLWFKVTERYPLTGEERKHRRRDLRGGGALGHITSCPNHPEGISMHVKFGEPHAGHVHERFYTPTPDLLHVDTVMRVRGQTLTYRQVYHRRKKGG